MKTFCEGTLNALNEIELSNIGRGPNLWGAINQRTNIHFKCPNKVTNISGKKTTVDQGNSLLGSAYDVINVAPETKMRVNDNTQIRL